MLRERPENGGGQLGWEAWIRQGPGSPGTAWQAGHGSCLMEGRSQPIRSCLFQNNKKDVLLGRRGPSDDFWLTHGKQSAKLDGGNPYAQAHTGGACGAWGGLQLGKSEQQPILEMPGPHTGSAWVSLALRGQSPTPHLQSMLSHPCPTPSL